jgi:hypothetical protein
VNGKRHAPRNKAGFLKNLAARALALAEKFPTLPGMSAKKNSKPGNGKPAPQPPPTSAPATPTPAAAPEASAEVHVAWIDSPDPRKRMVGKIAFVAVWVYVAALLLLALDQTFHWGIFGPKVPPVP